jgi:hypothetical protein
MTIRQFRSNPRADPERNTREDAGFEAVPGSRGVARIVQFRQAYDSNQEDPAMMMFLSLLCISLLAVAVLSVIVYGTSPRDAARPDLRPETTLSLGQSQFFAGDLTAPPVRPPLPIDAVIAQLERHVRLEQASAESFVEIPAPETLHAPAASRFLN